MVKRPLTPRDLELLSAYLDRQLSPREQQRLEERIRSNPNLQNTLDELRRTRAMLRSLPKVRAPRNFTLSPAMVPAPSRQLFFGLPLNWSAASALAVLFLMVFFVGDLMGVFSPRPSLQTAQRPSEAQALETAMNQIDLQSKKGAGETQDPGFNMPLPPENARGMGGGGGAEPEATLQTSQILQATPQASADQFLIITTPTPTSSAIHPMMEMAAPATITGTLSAASGPATEMAFVPPTEQAPVPAASQPEVAQPLPVLFTPWWIRIIEIALLLIALGAGVFAFTRRSR